MSGKITALGLPDPDTLEREGKIVELRRAGFTWEVIAERLGYSNASGAYKAYQRLSARFVRPNLEEYREMEMDRLDRMQAAIWTRAAQGETRAIDTVLKIIDRRARLLGLDAPTRIQAEVITYDADSIESRLAAIIAAADGARPISSETL